MLFTDDLILFIIELKNAFNGYGKVTVETVKGAVEYVKASNEFQIRNADCTDEQKDIMVKQETNRMTKVEVRIFGFLAYLGLLK